MTALTSLSGFPYLTHDEFTAACRALISRVDTFLHHDEGDPTTSLGWTGVRLEKKVCNLICSPIPKCIVFLPLFFLSFFHPLLMYLSAFAT